MYGSVNKPVRIRLFNKLLTKAHNFNVSCLHNIDIGYDVNNILAEKTQMNTFLLGLCDTFNNQNMGDAKDSATYMDNIVDKLLEAYHKYLLAN